MDKSEKSKEGFILQGSLIIANEQSEFRFEIPDTKKCELVSQAFHIGVRLAEEKWQEKTRWIPLDEQLPPKKSETRQVFVKNDNARIINWMIVSCFDDDYPGDIGAIQASFTHWKEIEL